MTGELKGHVIISRTVPKGPYSSLRVEVMEEYLLGQSTFEQKFDELALRLKSKLSEVGVVRD